MKSAGLLRASYWIGAVIDLINAVAMVYPPLLAAILGIDRVPASLEFRLALMMGSALMFGWTGLLIWADRKPIARKGILLITVFPVIVGLALTTVYGVIVDFIPLRGAIPVWMLQFLLTVLFTTAYSTAPRRIRAADKNDYSR